MPRNGNGNYALPSPPAPFTNGTTADASQVMTVLNDIASALSSSLSADGQTPPTADLSMGGHKLTGLANGTNAQDAATYGQVTAFGSSFRNALINGGFDVWQRGTSFSGSGYAADRWLLIPGSGETVSVAQGVFSAGTAFGSATPRFYASVSRSLTGSANSALQQRIENAGTFSGQTIAVSLYARGSVGGEVLFVGVQQNFGTGGSPSAAVVLPNQPVTLTTTMTRYTLYFTIPSTVGQTFGSNGDSFLGVSFIFPTSAGNVTWDLALAQVELGSIATTVERRPLGLELSLCQRYYAALNAGVLGYTAASGNFAGGTQRWPVTMRAAPTATFGTAAQIVNVSGATFDTLTTTDGRLVVTGSAAGSVLYSCPVSISAEL